MRIIGMVAILVCLAGCSGHAAGSSATNDSATSAAADLLASEPPAPSWAPLKDDAAGGKKPQSLPASVTTQSVETSSQSDASRSDAERYAVLVDWRYFDARNPADTSWWKQQLASTSARLRAYLLHDMAVQRLGPMGLLRRYDTAAGAYVRSQVGRTDHEVSVEVAGYVKLPNHASSWYRTVWIVRWVEGQWQVADFRDGISGPEKIHLTAADIRSSWGGSWRRVDAP